MSRAFVKEDAGDESPGQRYNLPPRDDPSFAEAAAWALLEGANEGGIAAAPFIDLLIDLRKELREAKQYQLADRIRDGLGDLGVTLEDAAGATTWKAR